MDRRQQIGLLIALGSVLVLALLAGSLAQLRLEPGLPFAEIWAFIVSQFSGQLSYGAFPQLGDGDSLAAIYRIILYVAIVCFVIMVFMVLTSREARRRLLRMIVLILLLSMVMGLVMSRVQEAVEDETEDQGTMLPADEAVPVETPLNDLTQPDTPRWVSRLASIALGLLIAGVATAVAWSTLRARREQARLMARLTQQVHRAISNLEDGGDLRDVVLKCYAEMSRVASERRGARREMTMTASEFIIGLEQAGLPLEPVRLLTHLFEEVRYGARETTPDDRRRAIGCLQSIIDACEITP